MVAISNIDKIEITDFERRYFLRIGGLDLYKKFYEQVSNSDCVEPINKQSWFNDLCRGIDGIEYEYNDYVSLKDNCIFLRIGSCSDGLMFQLAFADDFKENDFIYKFSENNEYTVDII